MTKKGRARSVLVAALAAIFLLGVCGSALAASVTHDGITVSAPVDSVAPGDVFEVTITSRDGDERIRPLGEGFSKMEYVSGGSTEITGSYFVREGVPLVLRVTVSDAARDLKAVLISVSSTVSDSYANLKIPVKAQAPALAATPVSPDNPREGMTAAQALAYLEVPEGGQITDAEGRALGPDATVGTGMLVQYPDGSEPTVLAIRGDVTGSGKIQISQLVRLAQAVTGENALAGPFLVAGDLSQDGKINIPDLVMEARLIQTPSEPAPSPEEDFALTKAQTEALVCQVAGPLLLNEYVCRVMGEGDFYDPEIWNSLGLVSIDSLMNEKSVTGTMQGAPFWAAYMYSMRNVGVVGADTFGQELPEVFGSSVEPNFVAGNWRGDRIPMSALKDYFGAAFGDPSIPEEATPLIEANPDDRHIIIENGAAWLINYWDMRHTLRVEMPSEGLVATDGVVEVSALLRAADPSDEEWLGAKTARVTISLNVTKDASSKYGCVVTSFRIHA